MILLKRLGVIVAENPKTISNCAKTHKKRELYGNFFLIFVVCLSICFVFTVKSKKMVIESNKYLKYLIDLKMLAENKIF